MKELTREEIQEFQAEIELLKNKEEYKYFFTEEEGEYDRVFKINGYYITLTIDGDLSILGLIRLGKGSLNGIIELFRQLVKEYGHISFWRYKENEKLKSVHEHIKKKYEFMEEIEQDDIIFITIGGAERGRRKSTKENR